MKVCILSMQRVKNYGSLLQAYGLKKIVEKLINEQVYFEDIIPGEQNNLINLETKVCKNRISFFSRVRNRIQLELNNYEYLKFQRDFLHLSDKLLMYDVCIIGSDEVFNCTENSKWGFTTQLFGNVSNANKVITYAASAGKTKFEKVTTNRIYEITKAMKRLDAISVRDQNTFSFVYNILKYKPELHLDPVVISDFDKEISLYGKRGKIKGRYCILYSYYHRFFDKNEVLEIKKFCKRNGLKIYSIEGPQTWIKKHLSYNPFEVLQCFKNAEFVITDTFHGTIFAAKYARKFAVYYRESNLNKLNDLVDRLSLQSHVITFTNTLEDVYQINNDFLQMQKIEEREYSRTWHYLCEALDVKGEI